MAINTLVGFDVEVGSKILAALGANGIDVTVALWAKLEDYGDWRFYLASKTLDEETLFKAYSRIASAAGGDFVFGTPTISFRKLSDPFIAALRSNFREAKSVFGMRLGGQVFGGHSVEEAFVYKIV